VQPLRLIIPGRYWDSQIYKGRLYLFGRDADVRTIDWDKLISEWNVEKRLRLALDCAFRRSDYLYGNKWSLLFADEEMRELVQAKFRDLAADMLEISSERMERFTVGRQDSPFPFPHADSTMYRDHLYAASRKGVFRAKLSKRNKKPVGRTGEREWDAPTLAVAAKYHSLALAAGDAGLFELHLSGDGWGPSARDGPVQLAKLNCVDCNWAFYSIYGSSHVGPGYLAAFKNEREPNQEMRTREFLQLLRDDTIFHNSGYSWGNQDKLCQVSDGQVRIMRYQPWQGDVQNSFEDLGGIDMTARSLDFTEIGLAPWKGGVVSGGIALFGTIVECQNAVVVIPSQGAVITLPGEPVNWRVFPRSVQYENQLHLIYEDKMEILSFNHDYFVDQNEKRSGIKYTDYELPRRIRLRRRMSQLGPT
jgi:hypothetical protein